MCGSPSRASPRRTAPASCSPSPASLPDVLHTSVLTPRHPDGEHRPRRRRPRSGSTCKRTLAPQRAPLRRPAGPRQGRDAREVRPGAVPALAPLVRRAAAPARRRRRVLAGRRPALRRPRGRRAAAHRVPEGRHRADAALLGVRHLRRPARGQDRARDRARQLAARARQAPRRHLGRRHRRAQHPDRHPARLPPRRGPHAAGAGEYLDPEAAAAGAAAVAAQGKK